MILTPEQEEILQHTANRSANKMYCGSRTDGALTSLVGLGLMRVAGYSSFLPSNECYYSITNEGHIYLGTRAAERAADK